MARMSPEREAEILEAYKRHRSVKATAFVCCTGPDQVRRIAKAAGVLRPPGERKELPEPAELERMAARAGSQVALARELGVHVNTIGNRLRGRVGR
jgi:hypothetical protein